MPEVVPALAINVGRRGGYDRVVGNHRRQREKAGEGGLATIALGS